MEAVGRGIESSVDRPRLVVEPRCQIFIVRGLMDQIPPTQLGNNILHECSRISALPPHVAIRERIARATQFRLGNRLERRLG